MATLYLIFGLVIAALSIIFALQNSMTVTISFLAWEATASLSLILLITLAIGALIGLLVLTPSGIKRSIAASSSRKRIAALEKELDEKKAKIAELEKPQSDPASLTPQPTTSLESSKPNP
jgi:lipopolysaccharide assembly protein A